MGGLTEDGLEEYFNFEGSGLALFQLSDILDSLGKGPFKNYVILLGEGVKFWRIGVIVKVKLFCIFMC